jgi:hypothetical protein
MSRLGCCAISYSTAGAGAVTGAVCVTGSMTGGVTVVFTQWLVERFNARWQERKRDPAVDRSAHQRLVQAAKPIDQERIVLKRPSLYFCIAAALLANAAFAQAPPPVHGGSRPPPPEGAAPPPPPPPKGAHLRIEQGENLVDLKCADDEPTRACADVAMTFLDRLGITPSRTTGSAPPQ